MVFFGSIHAFFWDRIKSVPKIEVSSSVPKKRSIWVKGAHLWDSAVPSVRHVTAYMNLA